MAPEDSPPATPPASSPKADFDLSEGDFTPLAPAARKPTNLDRLTPGMLAGAALVSTCLLSVLLIVPLLAFGASLWYGYQYVRDLRP